MKKFSPQKLILAHAIIWAAVMLALSVMLKGSEYYASISMFLIAGWFISHNLILRVFKNGNTAYNNRCNFKLDK